MFIQVFIIIVIAIIIKNSVTLTTLLLIILICAVVLFPDLTSLRMFNKSPSRAKLQTACEQGNLWLIECSLNYKNEHKLVFNIKL